MAGGTDDKRSKPVAHVTGGESVRRSSAATAPAADSSPAGQDATSSPGGEKPGQQDVVFIRGQTEDGKGLSVVRAREQRLEVGEVRPVEDGRPLSGDLVKLKPRPGSPRVCDVETQYSGAEESPAPSRGGPTQVATQAYRDNWDAIWARRTAPGSDELN